MRQQRQKDQNDTIYLGRIKATSKQTAAIIESQSKKIPYRSTDYENSIVPIIKINGQSKEQEANKQRQSLHHIDGRVISKNCFRSEKTRQISQKKLNFQINYSNFEKQYKKFGNIFIHTLEKLSCDYKFLQPDKEDSESKNFPVAIANILYGQNINNYNPYIEALDKLYDSSKDNVSKQKMERIKKLCHIGIAKNYFKSQKYHETPKYRRVNILIRTYMYENMRNIVQEKSQNYQNIVFIPCNKGALSFPFKKFPSQLHEICSAEFYQSVIQNSNKIIQTHYISYKKINSKQTVTDRWGQNLVYFLTFLFLLIFLATDQAVFTYIVAILAVLSIGLYVNQCKETLSKLGSSKNIIQKIQQSVKSYLKEINTHNMEWKLGQDFYWLEIHYIRKMKRKPLKLAS